VSVTLLIAKADWRKARGLGVRLKTAAARALKEVGRKGDLTVLLTGDEEIHALNLSFRGKDKPTDVLSFPAPAKSAPYLGDVALAYGVTAKDAKASGKRLGDHAVHLAVHGVLHLVGYDHMTPREAAAMQALETRVLADLGIPDPWAKAA
jgi:probable rRNA maturation factor